MEPSAEVIRTMTAILGSGRARDELAAPV